MTSESFKRFRIRRNPYDKESYISAAGAARMPGYLYKGGDLGEFLRDITIFPKAA